MFKPTWTTLVASLPMQWVWWRRSSTQSQNKCIPSISLDLMHHLSPSGTRCVRWVPFYICNSALSHWFQNLGPGRNPLAISHELWCYIRTVEAWAFLTPLLLFIKGRPLLWLVFCNAVLPMAARILDLNSARSAYHNESLQVLQSYMSARPELLAFSTIWSNTEYCRFLQNTQRSLDLLSSGLLDSALDWLPSQTS